MSRSRLLLATLAAYLPAAALPALAGRGDLPGGPLDPAALVVPFCLGFALAFPAWGRAADRAGPERVVAAALALMLAAGLLVALAPAPGLLVAGRALQGLAAAGVPPAVQAQLARTAGERGTGRALSGMMLAVAVATLAGPAAAPLLAGALGWTGAALLLGSAPALLLLALPLNRTPRRSVECTVESDMRTEVFTRREEEGADYADRRGVRAGWLVSALVLGGHWTVLTRLGEALGPSGLHAGAGAAGVAALTGAVGLPLVVLAARASDAVGPRRPMVATLAAGAAGFLLAATAGGPLVFTAAAGVGLAVYWAYLPVVAAQVQRSAGEAARGRAAGGLYASMWAAAGGAAVLASLAPSWREVLAGAGVAWGLAAVVAARRVPRHGIIRGMARAGTTAVAALTATLRDRILDGDLAPGERLIERALVEEHDVSRVTARSALARLAAEGLVVLEPHRGARVASLDAEQLHDLFALRTALEVEAARIALAERPAELDAELGEAVAALAAACRPKRVVWRRVGEAHEEVHRALVDAARSPRISAAHQNLAAELRLFVVRLRPVWTAKEMVAHHRQLQRDLPAGGPDVVRRHLAEGEHAVTG